ncbi:hypothetical protein [Gynuella sunshinyii]
MVSGQSMAAFCRQQWISIPFISSTNNTVAIVFCKIHR